jgi:hypothetical protein
LPPHFHAEKPGHWQVKVHFMRACSAMCEVVYASARPPTRAALKKLTEPAEAHQWELLQEWEMKVNVKAPGPER